VVNSISTGGIRNEESLSDVQLQDAINFAICLGMPVDRIKYSDNYYTGYGAEYDILLIGTDLYPGNGVISGMQKWNSLVSWKGSIGHELIGHREAALKGWSQQVLIYEEAQASIRAARFTPELTYIERIILIRDAVARLRLRGINLRSVRSKLNIAER